MRRRVRDVASGSHEVRDITNSVQLDFRVGPPRVGEGDGSLPPSWDVEVDPERIATGYEPVGETSIGTAAERYWHSRFSYLRTPAERLARLNEGRHQSDGTLSARLARLDKKRITQSYCGELGLTPFQRDEAIRAMLQLNLDKFGQQKRIEKVALAVIYVTVNYNRFAHLHYLDANRISETFHFKRLADEVGLDTRTMTRLSKRIKEELTNVGFFSRDTERLSLKVSEYEQRADSEQNHAGEKWPARVRK